MSAGAECSTTVASFLTATLCAETQGRFEQGLEGGAELLQVEKGVIWGEDNHVDTREETSQPSYSRAAYSEAPGLCQPG